MDNFEIGEKIENEKNEDEKGEWITIQDHKKYNELLGEIESLKSMIIDLHTVITLQNEGFEHSNNNISVIKEKINSINCDINTMKSSQEKQTKFGYIRDYIFPTIGMITVNYPIFWILGPKSGIIASTLSYALWKFT